MFVQWGLGLYHADSYYDSGGRVASLPILLSVVFCCAGIVLMGGYARAQGVARHFFFVRGDVLERVGVCARVWRRY